MKRSTWSKVMIAVVAIVCLLAFNDILAQDQKAPATEKTQVTAKAPAHQAGSAACIAAHKSGKCTGHDPGQCICGGTCGGTCGKHDGKVCSANCNKHDGKTCSGKCGQHGAKKKG